MHAAMPVASPMILIAEYNLRLVRFRQVTMK